MNGDDIYASISRVIPTVLRAAILLTSMPTEAQEAPAVDTSRWTCKYCPFEEGVSLVPELGAGYVSDDSAKFGEYTGLNEEGVYVVADAEGRYRSKDGNWLDLSALDLGLDSRYIGVEGGQQGKYRLHLSYKQLPHNISDTASSPFIGFGTGSLTLPSTWVPASTTDAMTALDQSLRGVGIETERGLFDLGAALTPVKHWAFAVNVRHEKKTGTRGTGGAFVFNTSHLPVPVDYQTDQIDLSAAYSVARFQARIAYYGSIFKNSEDTVTWANPYVPLVTGGSAGQLALAPSNEFHQLVVTAGYLFGKRTYATADIAAGRMTQDEAFLPYTINPSLPTQPLPRGSLDGRVDTFTGNVKITSVLADRVRVNAAFTYDDRDNQTSQSVYDWITTDTAAATPRTNLPYSFKHSVTKIEAGVPLMRVLRVDAGCDYDEYKRDLQEASRTDEHNCWAKGTLHAGSRANVMLMGSHARREADEYISNPGDSPPQNPLMRIYNMADRDRDMAKLRIDLALGERTDVGLDTSITWDEYFSSVIGVLDGRSAAVAADVAFAFSQHFSATGYLSHEQIESSQANAELLASSPIWSADNRDTTDTAGVGIKYRASDKLELGVDYTYARSTGEIDMSGAVVGFPDLTTRLNSTRLYVNFKPREKLALRLGYWYEDYQSEDWSLDDVAPSTISNVLAFGQGSPSYNISVFTLSGRYEF